MKEDTKTAGCRIPAYKTDETTGGRQVTSNAARLLQMKDPLNAPLNVPLNASSNASSLTEGAGRDTSRETYNALRDSAERFPGISGNDSLPIQMIRDRHFTFYTYMKTPTNHKLTLNKQGPHTVPHVFLSFLVDNFYWNDIFLEQVQPYTPQAVLEIINYEFSNETFETGEENEWRYRIDRFMNRYTELYMRLETACREGKLDGDPSSAYGDDLIEIMSMHPYGSYCWKPSQTAGSEELKGKGELALSGALKRAYDEGQKDESGNVNLPDNYKKYLIDQGFSRMFNGAETAAADFINLRLKDVLTSPVYSQVISEVSGDAQKFTFDYEEEIAQAMGIEEMMREIYPNKRYRDDVNTLVRYIYEIVDIKDGIRANTHTEKQLGDAYERLIGFINSLRGMYPDAELHLEMMSIYIKRSGERFEETRKATPEAWFARVRKLTQVLSAYIEEMGPPQ